jgi:hypothetical protein
MDKQNVITAINELEDHFATLLNQTLEIQKGLLWGLREFAELRALVSDLPDTANTVETPNNPSDAYGKHIQELWKWVKDT